MTTQSGCPDCNLVYSEMGTCGCNGPLASGGLHIERKPCRHDSMRADGLLDSCCLKCGADGYWHDGHRHDEAHPSGKLLIRLEHHG